MAKPPNYTVAAHQKLKNELLLLQKKDCFLSLHESLFIRYEIIEIYALAFVIVIGFFIV